MRQSCVVCVDHSSEYVARSIAVIVVSISQSRKDGQRNPDVLGFLSKYVQPFTIFGATRKTSSGSIPLRAGVLL